MTENSPNFDPFVVLTDDRGEPWILPGSGPGTVYKCRHREDGGLWALRVAGEASGDAGPGTLPETLPELRHPSIAAIADTRGMEAAGGIPLAVEFCEGGSLKNLAAGEGPLPWPVVRWFAMQIADALEYAHALGLSHGAIHPSTIMLAEPWPAATVKLIDFGLRPGPSREGEATGESGDLSALGAALWWMLAGGDPFAGQANPDIPADFDPEARRVLLALLGKNPHHRVTSAAALGDLLADFLLDSLPPPGSGETHAPAQPGKTRPVAPAPKLPWPKIAAALAACLLLIGVPLALILRDKNEPSREAEELAAKEQAEREKAEREEQAAKELAAREQAEKERIAKEQAAREELAAKEQAEREQAAKEQAMREQAAREQAEKEQAAREQALREADALIPRLEKTLEDSAATTAGKEDAFRRCLELAKMDHPAAAALCGVCYWFGNGVARDPGEAARWFRKGAELGHSRAMLGLGNALVSGQGVPMDKKQAVEWWRKAADQGEPLAMNRLGEHFNSDAEDQDVRQAMDWWQKAAAHDIPEAMTNLGIHHAIGTLGAKDVAKAIDLWQKAADLGEPRAMTELGYRTFNGEIEGRRKEDAFPLFRKAAEADDPRAMTGLGVCHLTGTGTPENREEAEKWLRRASDLGEPEARKILETLDDR